MKTFFASIALTVAAFLVPLPPAARADHEVSINFFYSNLEPYGEWVSAGNYGYCWHPTGVEPGWRPYTVGNWAYTNAGWTWVSYEPYGWMVYHYGRWIFLEDYGWCWVPGLEWAPAWVSFRYSDEYVGWAPLPPEAVFRVGIGLGGWVDAYFDIGPSHYCFVPTRYFGYRDVHRVLARPQLSFNIYSSTVNVTHFDRRHDYVYAGGPSFESISRFSDRPLSRLTLMRRTDYDFRGGDHRDWHSRVDAGNLIIPAPRIRMDRDAAPRSVARKLDADRINRGWEKMGNDDRAQALRNRIKKDSQPPKALPDKPSFGRNLAMEDVQPARDSDVDQTPAKKALEFPPKGKPNEQGKSMAKTNPGNPAPSAETKDTKPGKDKSAFSANRPETFVAPDGSRKGPPAPSDIERPKQPPKESPPARPKDIAPKPQQKPKAKPNVQDKPPGSDSRGPSSEGKKLPDHPGKSQSFKSVDRPKPAAKPSQPPTPRMKPKEHPQGENKPMKPKSTKPSSPPSETSAGKPGKGKDKEDKK